MTSYLKLVEVLAIHDRMLQDFGGARGVRDAGALESALHRPRTGYYPDVVAEAAALLESLLVTYPFVDGNKRTAYAVADVFLRINGLRLVADTDDAYGLVIGVLELRTERFDRIERWLRDHVTTA